jgi:hypothetical protein
MNIRLGRKKAARVAQRPVFGPAIRPAVDPVDRAHCAATLAKTDPDSALADYLTFRLETGARLIGGAR